MKILITGGSTEIPIDQVRCISNKFKGKTGSQIADYFISYGHKVTLLSSAPDPYHNARLTCMRFRTFDDLASLMEQEIRSNKYDVVIHSAAVSDYKVGQVLVPQDQGLVPIDRSSKIPSSHSELYLKLIPTIKLIDQIRGPWGFQGKLVKFKLQVGISDDELINIAKRSVLASSADLIVANCYEWYKERAYIIGSDGSCDSIKRGNLPAELYRRLS